MEPWLLALIGVFVGCFARVILPYLRKARATPGLKFDFKYIITLIIALIISGIAASITMASYPIPDVAEPAVFFGAFAAGWGTTDIMNQVSATAPTLLKGGKNDSPK